MTRITFVLSLVALTTLAGCSASPEKNFDVAVLNTNMYSGFANDGLMRQLDQPTVRMVGNDPNQTEPMKRSEVISDKLQFAENNLARLKDMKQTDDNREMLQTSIELHEYMIPVYKNEYTSLAKMYDSGSGKDQLDVANAAIQSKYSAGFTERMDKLMLVGKVYAEKHKIKVNWPE